MWTHVLKMSDKTKDVHRYAVPIHLPAQLRSEAKSGCFIVIGHTFKDQGLTRIALFANCICVRESVIPVL